MGKNQWVVKRDSDGKRHSTHATVSKGNAEKAKQEKVTGEKHTVTEDE